ncbi:hypothetical protein CU044_0560 [Streptomyces sp. L-9-10]|nr:hypothetical protein CU044_0560 [Streptomyces sp. L-9-10]
MTLGATTFSPDTKASQLPPGASATCGFQWSAPCHCSAP